MKLWTVHNARHRKVKEAGIKFLDCTAMTGHVPFAPKKEHLWKYKSGDMSEELYTALYCSWMAESLLTYPNTWGKVLSASELAIGCVCGEDKFCHRYLLKDILKELCQERGIEYVYMGEFHGASK